MSDPACPFCDARSVERVGQWGGQIITAQWRCRACNSYFEAVREDFDDRAQGALAERDQRASG
jgi:transposase-like protein